MRAFIEYIRSYAATAALVGMNMKIIHEGNTYDWVLKREMMLDSSNRPITQSMFLELGYHEAAIYTLKENHYLYKGELFPSLKKLYLEEQDPTEYNFATTYLLGWKHWNRLQNNKAIRPYIDEWREELEMKMKYLAHREMMMLVEQEGGNYSAAKWLADQGWNKRAAGRPSKAEKERSLRVDEKVTEDFEADVIRLQDYK